MKKMLHADIRRALAERVTTLLQEHETLPIPLRPYQLEAIHSIKEWLQDPAGGQRAHIEHATGLGKTVLFASVVAFCAGLRVLVIVPTKILVEQTSQDLSEFTGGILGFLASLTSIQDEQGQTIAMRGEQYSDVVITTDESFASNASRLTSSMDPHLIIFDECQWGFVSRTRDALNRFSEAVIIGFSATPNYLANTARPHYTPVALDNNQTLYAPPERLAASVFGKLLDRRTVQWGVANGWLAPVAWAQIDFKVSLNEVIVSEGESGLDYQAHALTRHMELNWSKMTQVICSLYASGRYDLVNRQVFATCPSVIAAEELARAINKMGIPSACITGSTSTNDRRAIRKAYAEGRIRLLTSVMVLREGWNAPNAEVWMNIRPTKSIVTLIQNMGRVLRLLQGNPRKIALVLDGHFEDTTFAPLTAAALFAPIGQQLRQGGMLLNTEPNAPGPAVPAQESPYLLHGDDSTYEVTPIIVEFCGGKDGTFQADGELWATHEALKKRLGADLQLLAFWEAHGHVRFRHANTYTGREAKFYAFSDVSERVKKWSM